jgi:hypothetical protein
MDSMNYASEESATQARAMERKLQHLRPEAGILFISVKAQPCKDGKCKTFEVRLGVTKGIGESTGRALVRYVLHEEIDTRGLTILANVYEGVPGAARGNTGDDEAGAPPS